jgi:hypothetical protein
MQEMDKSYRYLFNIGTNGMLVVMALLFGRTAAGFAAVLSSSSNSLETYTGMVTIMAILTVLIGTIATISYAHNELEIPYRPIYFLIALLLVTLPFYVAVECVNRAFLDTSNGINKSLFRSGMIPLSIALIALILYNSLIFFGKDSRNEAVKQKFTGGKYASIVAFNIFGIMFAVLLGLSTSNMVMTIVIASMGFICAMIYLLFFWALQVTIRET